MYSKLAISLRRKERKPIKNKNTTYVFHIRKTEVHLQMADKELVRNYPM
jgi:hypothetical protein